MPRAVVDLDEGRGRIVHWMGSLRPDEFVQAGNPYKRDQLTLEYMIWDFSGVDDFLLTTDELRSLGHFLRSIATSGPRQRFTAWVAPQAVVFGQLRQLESFIGAWDERRVSYELFRTFGEAEAWIRANVGSTHGHRPISFATAG